MKKLSYSFLLVLFSLTLSAQTNLQVHYDFGSGRNYVTSTLEMFKPDTWGNTFFFVDMDFNGGTENHPSLAYMEIARGLKFWDGPFSAHIEYNGGLLTSGASGFPINNAYLAGLDWGWNNADFSKTLNLKVLYKYIQGKQSTAQLTGVWGIQLLKGKMTFTGFADLWWEKDTYAIDGVTHPVFITEPQLWYNLNKNLSVGSEVEFGYNFSPVQGFKVCPTLGAKWNF
ncbi:MAG: hypothetical protein AUK44_06635 [Porphyromonadaceae bacterium CG2_30_38_12]|nr:MAG: hypothetical protein AUK44_06635 [Porphyromonadaceae bacterium CG2_30_38_12]